MLGTEFPNVSEASVAEGTRGRVVGRVDGRVVGRDDGRVDGAKEVRLKFR